MIDEVDEEQQLLDAATSVGYTLGVMADHKETRGDFGESEALLTMSLQLIEAARAYEAADEMSGATDEASAERGAAITTLRISDAIGRIDSKLDMLSGICASASAVDFELVADGMAFTIEDIQSELASIREELGKHAKPTENADDTSA